MGTAGLGQPAGEEGLKVWPDRSPLSALATEAWDAYQKRTSRTGGE